jgi:hypothetical protein
MALMCGLAAPAHLTLKMNMRSAPARIWTTAALLALLCHPYAAAALHPSSLHAPASATIVASVTGAVVHLAPAGQRLTPFEAQSASPPCALPRIVLSPPLAGRCAALAPAAVPGGPQAAARSEAVRGPPLRSPAGR